MFGFRISALVLGAGLVAFGAAAPAAAQGLSQYGMWGGPPASSKPSYLGAGPAMMKPVDLMQGGGRPSISAKAPQTASFSNGFAPGSIVIDTAGRQLYYTLSQSAAYG